jgi:hypothetical protein
MKPLAEADPECFRKILRDYWLRGKEPRGGEETSIESLINRGIPRPLAHAFYISLPLKDPTTFDIPELKVALKALKSEGTKAIEQLFTYVRYELYPKRFEIKIRLGKSVRKFLFKWNSILMGFLPDFFDKPPLFWPHRFGTLPSPYHFWGDKFAGIDKIQLPKDIPAQHFLVDAQCRAYPLVRTVSPK